MQFEALLPTNPTDGIQLALIAMLIYGLLRMVRGTIAASILRGAVLLVAVMVILTAFLLKAFEFTILQSILSHFVAAVVTALIVVFQPELRRGLLSLGEHRLFDRFRVQPRTGLDELAVAAANLARDRHGALFAVERRAALHHITATGVSLDAEVRADLLANIFWPGAPMHDGGVVIRGDRVVSAGCIFPLAERRDLSSRLGTRHRAGIGLSEESDAVVVIVSEETGGVSLAVDGELRSIDPPSELGRHLRAALASASPTRDPAAIAPDAAAFDGTDDDGREDGDAGPEASDDQRPRSEFGTEGTDQPEKGPR